MEDNTVLLILTPEEVDVLRGFLGEALDGDIYTSAHETLEGIYNALVEYN